MKVELLDYTKCAKELLILVKNTRRFDDLNLEKMTDDEKNEQLKYIFNTISGPWEFIDYTFKITGVTRGFTHQFVRQRVGVSFAQESLRIVEKNNFEYLNETESILFESHMQKTQKIYNKLLKKGISVQLARGILPINIKTAIICKINLRALNTMMGTRLCIRAAGEYQRVAKEIKRLVLGIHPWAEKILRPFCLQWGVCKFSNYHECPLKKKYPELQKDENSLDGIAKDFEKISGFSKQPK